MKKRYNLQDRWPETPKQSLLRRLKAIERIQKSEEQLAAARKRKIESLRKRIAKLERENDDAI